VNLGFGKENKKRNKKQKKEFLDSKFISKHFLNDYNLKYYIKGKTHTTNKKNKNIKIQEGEEEEGVQMFRCPLSPPLANCPFDIGINLLTLSCSSTNTSSSSSPLNILILFS
jgi:hypothetical protein